MAFIQEQRPPLNNAVGSSIDRLCADFVAEQLRDEALNSTIRRAREHARTQKGKFLRVMTYNVYSWSSPDKRNSADRIFAAIADIDADVICLNEANGYVEEKKFDGEIDKETRDILKSMGISKLHPLHERMAAMGYPYTTAKFGKKIAFRTGNVVFSRVPLTQVQCHTLSSVFYDPRNVLEFVVNLPNEAVHFHTPGKCRGSGNNEIPIRFFATHLDVYDMTEATRVQQLKFILSLAQERSEQDPGELQVLLGDFNALRRADYSDQRWEFLRAHDALREVIPLSIATDLVEANGFIDSFAFVGAPSPQCTTWSSRRVDYIYLHQNFRNHELNRMKETKEETDSTRNGVHVMGTYVYHTSASDHIPVIVDFFRN